MLMRKCDACKQPIYQRQFAEISMRILCSDEEDSQSAAEEFQGDYCDSCVASGKAVEDLVSSLKIYKGLESSLKDDKNAK